MPPPPHFVRGRINKIVLATHSCARALPTATTPKIDSLPANKEGSGAPKGACHPCPRLRKQVCATCATHLLRGCAPSTPPSPACGGGSGRGRARLSALTLAALATGYHPDGSAPEPGFPKTDFASVLPARPSCLRLSTLRADRSLCRSTGDPEPPGSGLAYPRAGTAPRFRLSGLPFRKGALNERGVEYVTGMRTDVKRNVTYAVTAFPVGNGSSFANAGGPKANICQTYRLCSPATAAGTQGPCPLSTSLTIGIVSSNVSTTSSKNLSSIKQAITCP